MNEMKLVNVASIKIFHRPFSPIPTKPNDHTTFYNCKNSIIVMCNKVLIANALRSAIAIFMS